MINKFFLSEINPINQDQYYELISTGINTDPRYGNFRYTQDALQQMADNFNNNVRGVEIAVDVNHDEAKLAYAWIKPGSMMVAPATQLPGEFSLFAQLYRFTPEGEDIITTGKYRYFSLEIHPQYEYVVGNLKKFAKNVIVGLALTNSPVIKGLAPTYAEQQNSTNNPQFMSIIKPFLDLLKAKGKATPEEKAALSTMLQQLSPEDQSALGNELSEVMALPEDTGVVSADETVTPDTEELSTAVNGTPTEMGDPEPGDVSVPKQGVKKDEKVAPKMDEVAMPMEDVGEPDLNPEEEEEESATKVIVINASEKKAAETAKLSEAQLQVKKLSEQNKKFAEENKKLSQQLRANKLEGVVAGLMLSESNPSGFVIGQKDEVSTFVSGLNDEQIAQFSKLVGVVRTVDFSERGHSAETGKASDNDVDSLKKKILSERPGTKEDVALREALGILGLVK